MRRRKARPGDERLIHDETQDWAERGSALSRLAADDRSALESVARAWLSGNDPELAVEGLSKLFTYWFDSPHAAEYVKSGIDLLEPQNERGIRAAAVACLTTFMDLREDYRDQILHALLQSLERDDDPGVQEECYRTLLEAVKPDEIENLPDINVRFFDREIDVRWDLLAPLRERYRER